MTTPGGVPNLPVGALTLENLQSRTQDTSVEANRQRANERISGIFGSSSGGNPASDLSPFGILTQLFSGFNSVVSRADPNDISGPEDLPGLLVDFIEELPVVGQFVDLWNAINGTYDGDDEKLLAIQTYFVEMKGEQEAVQAAWSDLFADAWETLTSGRTLSQKLGDLQAAWDSFAFKIAGIEADQTLTIVKVLQQLLPGLIPEGSELPTGIIDLQDEERAKQLAWNALLQAGWAALTSSSMTFPQKIAALQAAWDVFADKMGDIQADQTLTIQKILNQFFPGLFPDGENPTGLELVQQKADEAADNFAGMLDGVLGTGHGIADFVNWLQARRDEAQATWNNFWQGIFGGSAAGKTPADVKTAAASLTSTANTAATNAGSALTQIGALIDSVLGGGHVVTDLASYITSTWNGLVSGWNNLWDGIFGTSGSSGKTANDVKTAASSVASTANTANTNAGLAQTTANTSTSWLGRLLTDLTILFDWLHLTYPVGTDSDTKTTTSGGKRTWYSAWADLLDLVGASQNTSAPSDPASAIGDRIVQTEINQKNAQNFQISALTGGYRNPMWACRYPVGDVSYPEALNIGLTVYDRVGSPAPKSGNAAYVSTDSPWAARAAGYTVPQNTSRGAYIIVSNTAVMDTLGIIGFATGGTTNNVLLELFRVEPGVGMTRIFYTDVSAQLDSLSQYIEVDLPAGGILAQAGESYLVRLRNNSTVATTVAMQGIGGVGGSVNVGFYTANATDTNKTTYTTAEADGFTIAVTPFALFASKGQVATDQLYADDFNRSGMGALWYLQSTNSDQLGISFGTASYMGSADGHQHGLYTRPLASDRMWSEGNFYNINSSTQEGLLLCCNRDLSQIVYLAVNNAGARIYSGSATSLMQRATVSTLFNSVPWQFYYDPPTKKYTVLKAGKDIGLSWTDSGNLTKHGSLYRYGGLRISHANLFHGGTIDNWLLKDWS